MQRQNNQVMLNLGTGATGEARNAAAQETEIGTAKACLERPAAAGPSMEWIVERNNMRRALEQVRRNKGAPGADGMTVDALASHLKKHWPAIRAQLLDGTYQPQPVRRVEIPKASGGTRLLGIPCVIDRLIQQAALQVLQAAWDPTLSEHSLRCICSHDLGQMPVKHFDIGCEPSDATARKPLQHRIFQQSGSILGGDFLGTELTAHGEHLRQPFDRWRAKLRRLCRHDGDERGDHTSVERIVLGQNPTGPCELPQLEWVAFRPQARLASRRVRTLRSLQDRSPRSRNRAAARPVRPNRPRHCVPRSIAAPAAP